MHDKIFGLPVDFGVSVETFNGLSVNQLERYNHLKEQSRSILDICTLIQDELGTTAAELVFEDWFVDSVPTHDIAQILRKPVIHHVHAVRIFTRPDIIKTDFRFLLDDDQLTNMIPKQT